MYQTLNKFENQGANQIRTKISAAEQMAKIIFTVREPVKSSTSNFIITK